MCTKIKFALILFDRTRNKRKVRILFKVITREKCMYIRFPKKKNVKKREEIENYRDMNCL